MMRDIQTNNFFIFFRYKYLYAHFFPYIKLSKQIICEYIRVTFICLIILLACVP